MILGVVRVTSASPACTRTPRVSAVMLYLVLGLESMR